MSRPSFLSRHVFPTHSGTLQEAQDEATYLPRRARSESFDRLEGPSSSRHDGIPNAPSTQKPDETGSRSRESSSTASRSESNISMPSRPSRTPSPARPTMDPEAGVPQTPTDVIEEKKTRKKKKPKHPSTHSALYQHRVHGARLNKQLLHTIRHFRPNLVLENSGSVARDHLASERTFLAYVRTSIAIASTGVALVQLFTIADITSRVTGADLIPVTRGVQRFARPLGITCVVLALITLVLGMYRYFLIQVALPEQYFPVARSSMAFIAFVVSAVVVVMFAALVSGRS